MHAAQRPCYQFFGSSPKIDTATAYGHRLHSPAANSEDRSLIWSFYIPVWLKCLHSSSLCKQKFFCWLFRNFPLLLTSMVQQNILFQWPYLPFSLIIDSFILSFTHLCDYEVRYYGKSNSFLCVVPQEIAWEHARLFVIWMKLAEWKQLVALTSKLPCCKLRYFCIS